MWNYLDHSTLLKLSQVLNNNFHSILFAALITEQAWVLKITIEIYVDCRFAAHGDLRLTSLMCGGDSVREDASWWTEKKRRRRRTSSRARSWRRRRTSRQELNKNPPFGRGCTGVAAQQGDEAYLMEILSKHWDSSEQGQIETYLRLAMCKYWLQLNFAEICKPCGLPTSNIKAKQTYHQIQIRCQIQIQKQIRCQIQGATGQWEGVNMSRSSINLIKGGISFVFTPTTIVWNFK